MDRDYVADLKVHSKNVILSECRRDVEWKWVDERTHALALARAGIALPCIPFGKTAEFYPLRRNSLFMI